MIYLLSLKLIYKSPIQVIILKKNLLSSKKNNYFVQETEQYFQDISAKTYFSSYKENDNTNNQTNR